MTHNTIVWLQRVKERFVVCETYLAAGSLLLLLLLSIAQIISRNFMQTSVPYADLLTRHIVLYIMFFGAVLAIEADHHIKIDILSNFISDKWRSRLVRPLYLIAMLACILFTIAATRFWMDEWFYASGDQRLSVIINLILPFGFGLLSAHFLVGLIIGAKSQDY